MAKHTPGSATQRPERPGRVEPAGRPLHPEDAFVVQLRGGPARDRTRLAGRVEHVVSGRALRFASTAELIEFLTRDSGAANLETGDGDPPE